MYANLPYCVFCVTETLQGGARSLTYSCHAAGTAMPPTQPLRLLSFPLILSSATFHRPTPVNGRVTTRLHHRRPINRRVTAQGVIGSSLMGPRRFQNPAESYFFHSSRFPVQLVTRFHPSLSYHVKHSNGIYPRQANAWSGFVIKRARARACMCV